MDLTKETKTLRTVLLENQEDFISGNKDLNQTLDKTDELYNSAVSSSEITASKILQDSGLLELQTKIIKQCAKAYSIDTLVFNPREFSIKVRNFFCARIEAENQSVSKRSIHTIWGKLGDISKEVMYTVPDYSFLYGSFDAEQIEVPQKKKKQTLKDKIGEQTKPEKMDPNASSKQEDVMLANAERILAVFERLAKKSKNGKLCFYEFVTDPQSYTRTIEHIFLVSLLVRDGYLSISLDGQKLPCLKSLNKQTRTNKEQVDVSKFQQAVVTLTMEDWQDIINTFGFKTSVIPPRQS